MLYSSGKKGRNASCTKSSGTITIRIPPRRSDHLANAAIMARPVSPLSQRKSGRVIREKENRKPRNHRREPAQAKNPGP